MNWIDFWSVSAEIVNQKLRNNSLCDDELFYYYKTNLQNMEKLMFQNYLTQEIVVYRNITIDIYINLEDQIFEKTFLSCFFSKNDEEYGHINIEIVVPKGTPVIMYENLIILPKADYEILNQEKFFYVIRLISYSKIFS